MREDIRQSIIAIERAMESLNQAFERHADSLRESGQTKELQQWITATQAMKDSGNIYMTWARHYSRTTGGDAAQDEVLQEFLDEGSDLSGDRPLL